MKKSTLLFIIFWAILSTGLFAQTPIKLEINHKLGQQTFAYNQMAQNSMMIDFELNNLRYYLSGFSITHDGGQVIEVPDTLVFVDVGADASGNHVIELGAYTVSQIEGISFYMGIDSARNHLDPAAYPEGHPLALKDPSMHWGWASGYFFLSLNGKSGLNLRSQIDLQCLGDVNYFQTTVDSPLVTDYTDELLISIDGDYTKFLHGIDISKDISMHGEFLWANQALVNASWRVFKPSTAANYTAIDSEIADKHISIYPNPLKAGQKLFIQSRNELGKCKWVVSDLVGKEIKRQDEVITSEKIAIPFHHPGIYVLTLISEDGEVFSKKVTVE